MSLEREASPGPPKIVETVHDVDRRVKLHFKTQLSQIILLTLKPNVRRILEIRLSQKILIRTIFTSWQSGIKDEKREKVGYWIPSFLFFIFNRKCYCCMLRK